MSTMTTRPAGIIRSIGEAHTEVNKKRGLVRAIVSDDSNDRYRTAFLPDGCDYSAYLAAGGPVLIDHGMNARGTVPVGNAEAIEASTFRGRRCLVQDTRFWDTDEQSRMIKDAYESKRMRGWSIKGLPNLQSPPTSDERRSRPDWAGCELVYRRFELIETSVTSTPGNAGTLTQEVLRSAASMRPKPIYRLYYMLGMIHVYDESTDVKFRCDDIRHARVWAALQGGTLLER